MTDNLRLDTLPYDVLLKIFDYCGAFDLIRLSEVCRRFHEIISEDVLWIKRRKQPLVTNQVSQRFCDRCDKLLSLRDRWHVSSNWQKGKYEKRSIFSQRTKLMPWLHLTKDILWWSGGTQLYGFRRTERILQQDRIFEENNMQSDISRFVLWGDHIVTGHRDGNLNFWTRRSYEDKHFSFDIVNAHTSDVNALDKTSNIIISGSDNGIVKLWNMHGNVNRNTHAASIDLSDKIWSLAADPSETKFAVGLAAYNTDNMQPIRIYDIECYRDSVTLNHKWRKGAGTLDMVWDSPHILLSCGYDTYVRKWDIRSGRCVNSWMEPTDATLYCLSSDYQYSIIAGAQFNCKAVLWDQRQINYAQIYFMNLQKLPSPIYSLQFDSTHLYCATDQHMVELKFSGYSYKEHNYGGLINYNSRNINL